MDPMVSALVRDAVMVVNHIHGEISYGNAQENSAGAAPVAML